MEQEDEEDEGEFMISSHTRSHDRDTGSARGRTRQKSARSQSTPSRSLENGEVFHTADELTPTVSEGTSGSTTYQVDEDKGNGSDTEGEQEEATPRATVETLPEVVEAANPVQAAGGDVESKSESESGLESESEPESESSGSKSDISTDDETDAAGKFLALALAKEHSKQADKASAAQNTEGARENGDEMEEDVWMLRGSKAAEEKRERPIPGLSVPESSRIPMHSLSLEPRNSKGKKRAAHVAKQLSKTTVEEAVKNGHEVDDASYEKQFSRSEKLKLPPRQSASQAWSALPPIPSALLPQMKRDYQALSLRDSLDPKRFMKGKAKTSVPDHFAIGTLVAPPRHLQSTTLQKEKRYNPGDITQALVADSELSSYAKRKFDDFAGKKMDNGKGKGWKKRKGSEW